MAEFAAFSLELLSPLHLGSRRAGIVAQTHRFAPGHLFVYALAAGLGGSRGGSPAAYADALDEILRRFRFGPAFFVEDERRLTEDEVGSRLLSSSHHVSLSLDTRAAVDRALFEVERLQTRPGSSIRLAGGVWFDTAKLDGKTLPDWLSEIFLGGELKTGHGRVRCTAWQAGAQHYPGIGSADARGLRLQSGDVLPGPTLTGVVRAPLIPWLGRRHDKVRGFGRRVSLAAMVRLHGQVVNTGYFLPANDEPGLGCWQATE